MEGGTRPAGWETWQQRLRAGPSSVSASFVVPSEPTGWVVVGRPATALDGPSVDLTITELGGARLATMVVDLPKSDLATLAGWVNVAATHLRADRAEGLPIAYLGTGMAAAAGWAAALGGEINGVMGWNARPGRAWAHLPSVRVPSVLVVDQQAPWLRLLASATRWRLGSRADVLTGVPVDDMGILAGWYRDRLLRPTLSAPRRQPAGRARRAASVGIAAALGVAPGAAFASAMATTVAARPALAEIPDFSAGRKLKAAEISGDSQPQVVPSATAPAEGPVLAADEIGGDGPRGDPPLTDGLGFRWNVNTNIGFTTTSSASGAVSEAGFTHAVAATTLNGGTVNQVLADAFDGYNALCIDLNNVGGQCNTANMAVYNQNGPASLECSGRQVVLPQRTMGNFQVRRKVFVPTNDGFARWLDIVRNTSASPQTVRLVTSNNLGSDAGTRIVTTSDGDATPELSDTWVTTFQNYSGTTSSDPRLGHVLRGLGAPVGLAVNQFANGDDNPFWRYQFTLAPGQTGIIMNYATGQATKAAAATESAGLAALSNANALACMTAAEGEQVVNFVTGSPAHGIQASAGGPLGTAVSATSTLTAFNNPSGTMTFNLYGPNDNTCVGAPVFTQAVPVNGNGVYNSPSHAPIAPGTYIWTAAYSGDGINSPSTTPCNSATASVVITPAGLATPTISTQASAGGPVGTVVNDAATLSGGVNPVGTISFSLFGPGDTNCTGPVIANSIVGVFGNGNYTSGGHVTALTGTYRWTADYSGDVNNNPVTSPCNAPNESVTIVPASPTISTQASTGGPVGTSVNDVATVSGGSNPTGTVTFRLFTDAACTNQVFTSANALAGGTATSSSFPTAAPGTYFWTAVYNGDANNNPATSPCGAANESVTIVQGSPTISTQASAGGPVGTSVNDVATVSGGSNPTGTVTFRLFTDAACTNQVFTSANALAGGTATSSSFPTAAPGTYFWTAVYNGDANNNPATSPCGAPNESVTIVQAPPTITTQASSGAQVTATGPSASISDTATLAGGVNPTGTITFRLFGPNDAACAGAPVFTDAQAVNGNGAYTSNSYTTAVLGTYRWVVDYSGDANNLPASSPCNAPNETSEVSPVCATPPPPGTLPGNTIVIAAPGLTTIGTPGNDVIYGTAGNDFVDGRGGDDVIFGQGGNDQLTGGDGRDTVCGGEGNDRLFGSAGNDLLSGDDGDDDLAGGDGDDLLVGGPGLNRLAGGLGTNTCIPGSNPGSQTAQCQIVPAVAADFGDDFITDVSLMRPTSGTWFVQGGSPVAWGTSGDVPVPGDYDGDNTADIAVFRPDTGTWFVQDGPTVAWGIAGDVPAPGDYDGDGRTDIAVFRPDTGTWFIQDGPTVAWGTAGDVPVPGDYDGDGRTDIAVFRPDTGTWFIQDGPTVAWGTAGDVPVPGDYDGDGRTDIAVFRPDTGTWFVQGGSSTVAWGSSGDVPVPGDYDGNRTTDIAVFRPSSGTWFVLGGLTSSFGTAGDQPLPLPAAIRAAFF